MNSNDRVTKLAERFSAMSKDVAKKKIDVVVYVVPIVLAVAMSSTKGAWASSTGMM